MKAVTREMVRRDLNLISAQIAMRNPARAKVITGELRDKMFAIARSPHLYQQRPELGETARVVNHLGYNIFFRIDENQVVFERVVPDSFDLTRIT